MVRFVDCPSYHLKIWLRVLDQCGMTVISVCSQAIPNPTSVWTDSDNSASLQTTSWRIFYEETISDLMDLRARNFARLYNCMAQSNPTKTMDDKIASIVDIEISKNLGIDK